MTGYFDILKDNNDNSFEFILFYMRELEYKNSTDIYKRVIKPNEDLFNKLKSSSIKIANIDKRKERLYDELFKELYPKHINFINFFEDLMLNTEGFSYQVGKGTVIYKSEELKKNFKFYESSKNEPEEFRIQGDDKSAVHKLIELLDTEIRMAYMYLNFHRKELRDKINIYTKNEEINKFENDFHKALFDKYSTYTSPTFIYLEQPVTKNEKRDEIKRHKIIRVKLGILSIDKFISTKPNYNEKEIEDNQRKKYYLQTQVQKLDKNQIRNNLNFNKIIREKDEEDKSKISNIMSNKNRDNIFSNKLQEKSKQEKYSNIIDKFSEDDSIKDELKTINHINQSDYHPTKKYFSSFKRDNQLYPPKSPKLKF